MTKREFNAIAEVIINRWPFSSDEMGSDARKDYTDRLWMRVCGWRGAWIGKLRGVVESMVDDKFRGKARPSVASMTEAVTSTIADDGRDIRTVQNERASSARSEHYRKTRQVWDWHEMSNLIPWSPSLETSFAALKSPQRFKARETLMQLTESERTPSLAYRTFQVLYREHGGLAAYLRDSGRHAEAEKWEMGT